MGQLEYLKTLGAPFGTLGRPMGGQDPSGNIQALAVTDGGLMRTALEMRAAMSDVYGLFHASVPSLDFDYCPRYFSMEEYYDTALTGTGTATHSYNRSSLDLNVLAVLGDKVIRQTRRFFNLQNGLGRKALLSFLLNSGVDDVSKKVGYFSDYNGIFLEQLGSVLNMCRRSEVSGSVVDTKVTQASWNLDPLNGTGPSGKTLDETKIQTMVIESQGMCGQAFAGFIIEGIYYRAHAFYAQNVLSAPLLADANLPLRYEIEQLGTSGVASLEQFESSVLRNCGLDPHRTPGYIFAQDTGATLVNILAGVLGPVLSIKLTNLFKTKPNRASVFPMHFGVYGATSPFILYLIKNGVLTSPSWTAVHSDSVCEYDISATAVAGGRQIHAIPSSQFVSTDASLYQLSEDMRLAQNIACNSSDILTLAMRPIGGANSAMAGIVWKEVY